MTFKGTAWLAAVFAGLLLYYFLIDVPGERKKQKEKEEAEKVLHFEPDNVAEIRLTKKNRTLHLKRIEKNTWELVEPLKTRADNANASALLRRLENTQFTRIVEEAPTDLSVYGLEDPSLKIVLKLKDRSEKILVVGDDNPMGNFIYVKRADENRILLAAFVRKELDKTLFDMRDKTLLNIDTSKIIRVDILREGKTMSLAQSGEDWEVSANGIKSKGDSSEIRNFLVSVVSTGARDFIEEEPESLAPYGLDSPTIKFTAHIGKEGETQSLLVGKKKQADRYYGKTGEAKNVVLLSGNLVQALAKKPVDFMDKTLLDFKEDEVAELNFKTKEGEIRVVRNQKDAKLWEIKTPIQSPASTATVNSLLFDLKEARITEFVKTSIQDPELFGLDKPKNELSVQFAENKSWTFKIGNHTSDGKFYFATRSGDSTVFTLPDDTAKKIFRSLHDLRNKKLLSFKGEDVHRILIQYPAKTFELKKTGDGWSLQKPEVIKKVKPILGKDILWILGNLEFVSIAESPPGETDSGLDKPSVTLTLLNEKNQKLGSVIVGNKVKDQPEYYARVEGKASLFRIKQRFLDEIPRDIEKFRG